MRECRLERGEVHVILEEVPFPGNVRTYYNLFSLLR